MIVWQAPDDDGLCLAQAVSTTATEIVLNVSLRAPDLDESPFIEIDGERMRVRTAYSDGRCIVVRGVRSRAFSHAAGTPVGRG